MIRVLADPEAVARAALEIVVETAARADAPARIALSGGRTPARLYALLARDARVDWGRIEILFADERAVPPDDADSNYRLVHETLLAPLGAGAPRVHRMRGEAEDLDRAAAEYEPHVARPLDLIVLGIGPDGHTASLFPDSPLLHERVSRVAAVTDSPKPPPRRLTLTPVALREAREIVVMATGRDKADVLVRALETDASVDRIPARVVRGRTWLVDRAAAADLKSGATPARAAAAEQRKRPGA